MMAIFMDSQKIKSWKASACPALFRLPVLPTPSDTGRQTQGYEVRELQSRKPPLLASSGALHTSHQAVLPPRVKNTDFTANGQ